MLTMFGERRGKAREGRMCVREGRLGCRRGESCECRRGKLSMRMRPV